MIILRKNTTYEDISIAMVDGVNDKLFSDLEDSYQAHIAMEQGCDILLTIDIKHFGKFGESGAIVVADPQAFIEKYCV